jgi:regulator of sirC expression with transglutaminase-like and TPR domain
MKMRLIFFIFFIFFYSSLGETREPSHPKIKALYSSLNPHSIAEHLAFYQLYPHSVEGKKACHDAWQLLNQNSGNENVSLSSLPDVNSILQTIIALINKEPNEELPSLSEAELKLINKLCSQLGNRNLKGYKATSEADMIALPSQEIDLARGIFLSQLGEGPAALLQIDSYEALIDLMALQILAQIPTPATPEQIIKAINHFVFTEMEFRFPPHSLYAKDIDIYTFLPAILDSRKGVCLGVSILYLSLAQRLSLPLEMVTPPGHIYVRYHQGDKVINIETTARGVDLESEEYLSLDTCQLQLRDLKEVIGFAYINQASVFLQEEKYEQSLAIYLKALPYLPHDILLKELLGFNYLFVGKREKAIALLEEVKNYIPTYTISASTLAEDYLLGNIDAEGIKAIFMHVDETAASILEKQSRLAQAIKQHPQFRAGMAALAITWLQLHREGEALEILEKHHALQPLDPTTHYYMAALYAERMDYNKAWEHLKFAEKIAHGRNHFPLALKELRYKIAYLCPEFLAD